MLAAAKAATAFFSLPDDADDSEIRATYSSDTPLVDRLQGESGVSSVQFVLASALALVFFLALANLVVVQYGRGAVRSALEQGARAGTTGGVSACNATAGQVVDDLLGGRMSDGLVVNCSEEGSTMAATASATFESWTPLMPDFSFTMISRAVVEP